MSDRVALRDKPLELATKLSGRYEEKFRYRVGDYRVVCEIHNTILLILVVEVGHRREIYR